MARGVPTGRIIQAVSAGLLVAAGLAATPASAQNMAWLKGQGLGETPLAVYGTKGVAAPENTPGPRSGAAEWKDASGNLWLFGGSGYGTTASPGTLNDLWKYDVASGNWTWMKGSNAPDQVGTYGTLGTADAANTPGARGGCVSWTDASGNLWLFGGGGARDTLGNLGRRNDLWKYDVASGNWTWMKGSSALDQAGTYGTQGTADAANTPGARSGSVSWMDASGNFWLFGGVGLDSSTSLTAGWLNDLWKYDVASGNWTWMKGSNQFHQPGTYGTQGTAAAANTPGARHSSVSWSDASGNLWLFGGMSDVSATSYGRSNDLWKYNVASGNWTWMKGSNATNQAGTYGTQGTAAAANTPGARMDSVSWTDASGNLWLSGGGGYGATAFSSGLLNDLWKYDVAGGNWTWIKGSNDVNQLSTYGTQGTAAAANTPGAHWGCVSWIDASGNFWLFGGSGYGATASSSARLNDDLWKYDVASGNWTWMKGSGPPSQVGTYGTQGTAAEANTPGVRERSVSWTDALGNFWLFGGFGHAAVTSEGTLSDLWKYDVASRNWTWMKGSNAIDQVGTYGTQGTAAAANTPGARTAPVSWTDASGNLWLFGGLGLDANGSRSTLNDLWKYDVASRNWTWMKGSNAINQAGTYGTQGTAAAANTPGARINSVSWTDVSGNLWLFGGTGNDVTGSSGWLNDLWKYDVASGNWTWMKGSNEIYQAGTYGTQGTAADANTPGGRARSVSWTDASGNFWLFGGDGSSATSSGHLNDLWKFDVASGNWTWMKGSNEIYQAGTYGTQGTEAAANTPGAREYPVSWTDLSGNLWLFGGWAEISTEFRGYLNDLWKYDMASGNWTWMKGSNTINQVGTYGIQGTAAAGNIPGGRSRSTGSNGPATTHYLFGGFGYAASSYGRLNDLWAIYLDAAPSGVQNWQSYGD